jgi:tRNA G18 (ribose-2'-O)-methylase SpoU
LPTALYFFWFFACDCSFASVSFSDDKGLSMLRKLRHDELEALRLSNETALAAERHPVSLLLHNIRSLYNVGSLFRTCDAALAQKLILCGYTPAPPRKEIEKTALGAVDSVPFEYRASSLEAIMSLRAEGMRVYGLELAAGSRSIFSLAKEDFPLCFVVGNEIAGVDDEVLAACDGAFDIPMYGVKHSLNVAVAAGIALFQAVAAWRSLESVEKSRATHGGAFGKEKA